MRYVLAPVLAPLMVMTMVPVASAAAPQQAQQWPQQNARGASLGTPMPDADVAPDRSFKAECGYRYRFSSRASVDAIVSFYTEQARGNGLTLAHDTRDQFPYTRMLGFDEKAGARLLFVQIERKVGTNTATVTFRTRKAPASCN